MAVHVVNIEAGMPTVERARAILSQAIRTAKAVGTHELKIIHGYGSSGRGGAIKRDTLRFLAQKKQEGVVKEFVSGEDFSPFSEATRRIIAKHPALIKDCDYSRGNDGITIVIL